MKASEQINDGAGTSVNGATEAMQVDNGIAPISTLDCIDIGIRRERESGVRPRRRVRIVIGDGRVGKRPVSMFVRACTGSCVAAPARGRLGGAYARLLLKARSQSDNRSPERQTGETTGIVGRFARTARRRFGDAPVAWSRARTSRSLIKWHAPIVAFVGSVTEHKRHQLVLEVYVTFLLIDGDGRS
ncbi:hypothetical protein EVAR_29353_1 [Eumeta japonica]|uniref:Uncharacterized protein n=1 Tax=Eumeta variegata TaxID=151549 RepID=A0A4C1WKE7_EUMVA|nr:hypothetical protein EVAR_29353_1 [Eumeta japonica]